MTTSEAKQRLLLYRGPIDDADPHFVPFTLALNWNSFHVVDDIAIATSVFEGDVTRNGKQIHFRGKNLLVWKKQADGSWKIFRYMFDEIPAKK